MMKRVVNFGIATAFTTFVVLYIVKHSYYISSESMFPTLYTGDVVFAYDVSAKSEIKSNDVVAFTVNDNSKMYVKRVKALCYVKADSCIYFMSGDNSSHSYDSRYFGWIQREKIRKKVCLVLWSWDSETHRLRMNRFLKNVK